MHIPAHNGFPAITVVLGAQVGSQYDALHNLLIWLIILGVATVVLTSAAGFYLAHRALLPARVAQERQRAFIADASHELRTPLTILRADADVLLRGRARLSDDDSALLEDMVAETSHMTRLADSMLNLARLDWGNGHIEQEVVDLAELGGDIARRAASLAAERDITIGAGDLEPAVVLGDRLLLEQAVLILIDNAIKYNRPGGSIDVRTARQRIGWRWRCRTPGSAWRRRICPIWDDASIASTRRARAKWVAPAWEFPSRAASLHATVARWS